MLWCTGMALPLLTPREAALDNFLSALFSAEDIVKAGFAFNGDLRNLCRSFPQLTCLGRNTTLCESKVMTFPFQQGSANLCQEQKAKGLCQKAHNRSEIHLQLILLCICFSKRYVN